ncbi:hypothetical protein JXJ21_09430 [candidate division KSB1 bacterium]|nr:hypothetical protein [candidate division KSB1 bacterium]
MRRKTVLLIMVCAAVVSSGTPVNSQEIRDEVIVLSDRVGQEIDLNERTLYKLFPNIEGFKQAVLFVTSTGNYFFRITCQGTTEGEERIRHLDQTENDINRLREYIDHFEEIKAGTYEFALKHREAPKAAEQIATPLDSLVTVSLKDGSLLKGKIRGKDDQTLDFVTIGGLEIRVPISQVESVELFKGRVVAGTFQRDDPNYSRLMFAPTGRPLRKGEGYFSDYYILFPGFSYGITNNFSLMAGVSVLPGLGLADQVKYIAPRVGFNTSKNVSLSVGALCASFADEYAAGIAFAVGTFGPLENCFTSGLGLGYTSGEDGDFEFAKNPIIVLGYNKRLSNSMALISENWFITGEGLTLGQQPLSISLRFFGDQLAADVGFIIVGEVIKHGLPIPWLSFVYNFRK